MANPVADWYDDPDNPGILRFWDGDAWTERRKPAAPPVVQRETDIAGGVFAGGATLLLCILALVSIVVVLAYNFG